MRLVKIISILHPIALLLLSIFFLLLLLASGHGISFHDSVQLKFITEIVIFSVTGIYLLIHLKEVVNRFGWVLLGSLVLVQVSFFDLIFEALSEQNDDDVSVFIFIMFCASNLLLIYEQLKIKIQSSSSQ